ncbi:hypothetical protein KOY_04879 [Bacillus cereus VDM021]|nr:hypothetical protein KOY_04879 [Bacillus cereus VDM021]
MEKFNTEALKAIEDITDEELMTVAGADGAQRANSSGVVCTVTHECHYNSISPSSWATCC